MNKPSCYRAVIMRVNEIEVEIWADSYEDAIRRAHQINDDRVEISNVLHDEEVVDVFPHVPEYEC